MHLGENMPKLANFMVYFDPVTTVTGFKIIVFYIELFMNRISNLVLMCFTVK